MSESPYRVRRATVEDLPAMQVLWASMHYTPLELEKRLTEFQVAVSPDGKILGALGIEVSGRTGRLHTEAFNDFALADTLRQLLWERMQSVAANHGLERLWIRESAPFWNRSGFAMANEETLKKLPARWAAEPTGWLTLKLRDEEALQMSLDVEFARFKEEEKLRTKNALQRARMLKGFATFVSVIMAIVVLIICVFLFLHRASLHGRIR